MSPETEPHEGAEAGDVHRYGHPSLALQPDTARGTEHAVPAPGQEAPPEAFELRSGRQSWGGRPHKGLREPDPLIRPFATVTPGEDAPLAVLGLGRGLASTMKGPWRRAVSGPDKTRAIQSSCDTPSAGDEADDGKARTWSYREVYYPRFVAHGYHFPNLRRLK